jgi:uncharacterized protein Usg
LFCFLLHATSCLYLPLLLLLYSILVLKTSVDSLTIRNYPRNHLVLSVSSYTSNRSPPNECLGFLLPNSLTPRYSNIVKAKYVRAWSKADWSQFRSHIVSKQLNFSNTNSKGESEDAIKYLYNYIEKSIEKAVPLIKMKPKFVSWWSQNLEWLLTKVKQARKRMIKNRTLESVQIFENSRSNWESAVRKAKQRYWK